jgi:glycosyltransferase involved in cell wall biosynthesis
MITYRRPRLSIAVPVRNGGGFLAQTLDSLLAQNYSDFELIISDNASTDETESVCRAYAAHERRIRYYRSSQDFGSARNYNHLFQQARAEYFKWAAADDLYDPEFVGCCMEVLERDQRVVLAYTQTRFIDENGAALDVSDPGFNLLSDSAGERLCYVIHASHWVNAIFGVIRAKCLRRTRLLPDYPGGDYALLGELTLAGKFAEIPESLFLRRLHPAASSQNANDAKWLMQFCTGNKSFCLPFWNRSWDHFRTIVSSELGVRNKFSLGGSVLRSMLSGRRRLLAELKGASADVTRSLFANRGPVRENTFTLRHRGQQ